MRPHNKYKFSNSSMATLETLAPPLRALLLNAITTSPVDFGLVPGTGGWRSAEEQRSLYLKDLSECDGVNTISYHQTGYAFDVFAYVDGKAVWDGEPMLLLASHLITEAAKRGIVLEWGGLWEKKDNSHFQAVMLWIQYQSYSNLKVSHIIMPAYKETWDRPLPKAGEKLV